MDYELTKFERFFSSLFAMLIALCSLLIALAFFGKAYAQDYENAGNFYTRQYVAGSASEFTGHPGPLPGIPGGPRGDWGWGKEMTDDQIVTSSLDAYSQCVAEFGAACRIKVIGYADDLAYGNLHDPHNGGLATQRAGIVGNLIRDQLGEEGATAVLIEGAAEARDIGQRYVHVRVYVERAVAVGGGYGSPTAAAPALAVPEDPDERWGFLNAVLLAEADNLCPTLVTADAVSRMYSVQYNDCPCSSWDVQPVTPEVEVFSDLAFTQLVRSDARWTATRDLTFSQIRGRLQEGASSSVIEVNENLGVEPTPDGLSVDFVETGTTLTARFPDRCTPILERQREVAAQKEEDQRLYKFFPGPFLGGSAEFGQSFILEGSPFEMTAGRDKAAYVEMGWVAGGPKSAWLFGVGAGAAHDPNCLVPSHFSAEVFAGPWLHRHGHVSFLALGSWEHGFAPYNGEWIGTRHRLSVDLGAPVQLDFRLRPKSKLYVVPFVGIGFDLVSAEGPSGGFGTTERQMEKGGVRVLKTF